MIPTLRGLARPGLVVLICAASLGGCSSAVTSLVAEGDPGEVCVPASVSGEATVMLDVLQNRSEGPARVMEVAPLEADGLSLAGWYLIDPEAEAPTVGPGFVDRSADEDDIVAPGSRAVLALGLRLTGTSAGVSRGVAVTYTEGGRTGTTHTVTALEIVPSGTTCG